MTADTVYSLTCSGQNSTSAITSTTVTIVDAAVPTATLSVSPTTIASGSAATLTWSSTSATSCTASGAWNGSLAGSGSETTGPLTADETYSLVCTGPGGTSAPVTATVTVATTAPLPTVSLSAAPSTVPSGGTSILSWSSSNATSCTASGGWTGSLATSGTQNTTALTANTIYSLVCTGPGGSSSTATAAITIAPLPTANLTASPTNVASGGKSTLSWSSTNATSCTASGGWSGTLATSGTQSTAALTANTSYSLVCSGLGGTSTPAHATVSVTASTVPTVTLAASPTTIASGGNSTLSWNSTNATSCTATGSWTGTLGVSGTQSTGALTANQSYQLTCTGTGGTSGTAIANVTVTQPAPTVTLNASPATVPSGGSSVLNWVSSHATACTASGSWTGSEPTSGSFTTPAITANANYILTCSGPGGSTAAMASVTITSGNVVVSPGIAALTLTQQQQFTATVPGPVGGGATWSVDSIAGGNASVGIITPTTSNNGATAVYTTASGANPGTHTITATSISNPSQSGTATAAVTNLTAVYTYHNDNARDGVNAQEYALTPANVKTSFGKITSCPVDGAVYAQPLWVANLQVNGAQHNVVFVATAHDGLFAFDGDANPCTLLWGSNSNLIDTSHGANGGEVTVPDTTSNDAIGNGYADISPEFGVIGTPVIDQTTHTLYVVSKSMSADSSTFYQRLHAIDITTGNEKAGSPVLITGTYPGTGALGDPNTTGLVTFSAKKENQRPGLVLLNGLVYISWGSHEDTGPWYGWIMSYQYSNGQFLQKSVLNISPNAGASGIWLSGGAPAVDSGNALYITSGNGTFDATSLTPPMNDYGDSLMKLTSSLAVAQSFTPLNQVTANNYDRDFGAGGITVLPDLPATSPTQHLMVTADKLGDIFLLNRDNLGGYGPLAPVPVVTYPTGNSYPNNSPAYRVFFGTGAFWDNNYYIGAAYGPLYSLTLNPSTSSLSPGPSSGHMYGFPGSSPSVSASSGSQNGIVWTLDQTGYCTNQAPSCGPVVLFAHDASNVANLLWNSPSTGTGAAGYAVKFTVPTIANGKVYVGTRGSDQGNIYAPNVAPGGELDIFGLMP